MPPTRFDMRKLFAFAVTLALVGCSSDPPPSSTGGTDTSLSDSGVTRDTPPEDLSSPDIVTMPDAESDVAEDTADTAEICDTLGCPCETSRDCRSDYCVRLGGDEGSVCTVPCVDDCPEEGWVCSLLEQDREALALCLPEALPYCEECQRDTDCGSTSALCVELIDGEFCAPPCIGDGLCPSGAICEEISVGDDLFEVCVPSAGVCADCVDNDNDGYGVGPSCLGLDCDDLVPAAFFDAPELCDGIDNDCDLSTDEDFSLSNDDSNCGVCGNACDGANSLSTCVGGECRVVECDEGFSDCDGDPANGCERPADALNACGGCSEIVGRSGDRCGSCDTGTYVCDGLESLTCAGDLGESILNECGGCSDLSEALGEACGTCESGAWACDGEEEIECVDDGGDDALNLCGGCNELDEAPGTECGTCDSGTWVCSGASVVQCVGDLGVGATNSCGGCGELPETVGGECGTCGSGVWACDGEDGTLCEADAGDAARNECGGCVDLLGESGDACGTCDSGTLACDGMERLACADDGGESARNSCGGCTVLDREIDGTCGLCGDGIVICNGLNSTLCFGADGDDDGDGVCDGDDVCPGGDDSADADTDGVADFCDPCPTDNPDDTDGDGVCESADVCPGENDTLDADVDGVPNACDVCRGFDDERDADVDGVPDDCDCDTSLCDANATCAEDGNGVICSCNTGYEGDGRSCSDVDECVAGPCDANAVCSNTLGGFTCACAPGYAGDGFTCADIDECADGTNTCDPLATCSNTASSYTCECPPGWTGDGFTCSCPPERASFETIATNYLSGQTPNTVSLSDDSVSGFVPIGFNFTYFGNTYSQVRISSNGFFTFNDDATTGCCSGIAIPSTTVPNNLVAVWWEDLDPPDGGSVRYGTGGVAPNRYFIVEYASVAHYPSGTPITAQAILYESSNLIDINCQNCATEGGDHSQGVEDASGTLGVSRYFGTSSIESGSWRFTTCAP